jgi:hypothetical protein
MNLVEKENVVSFAIVALLCALCTRVSAQDLEPIALLEQLDAYPHATQIDYFEEPVIDHEIGLGAIQKSRGEWRFKRSVRLSGTLISYTWQITDGFTADEVMDELLDLVAKREAAELLFACKGRACGPSVQWANWVFSERVLYGREEMQRYRVYALAESKNYRLVAYSAARTTDRQYLRVELLQMAQ